MYWIRAMSVAAGKAVCCILPTILCALVPVGAVADDAGLPADLTELSISELMEIDLVYGASRYVQKISDAPASVTIITRDDMLAFGHRTLAEVLNSVAGFYYSYDRNYHYLGARGFGPPGDYNSRTLILVDGHRVNENIYGSAPTGTDFILSLDVIERIEVIRGPSSSIYGTNAFLGVINVITRSPSDYEGGEAVVRAGSVAAFEGTAGYGKRLPGGLGFAVTVSGADARGGDVYYSEFDDPATNNGVFHDGDGDRRLQFLAGLDFRGLKLQAAAAGRSKHIPTGAYGTVFNDSRTMTSDAIGYVDLSYGKALTDGLEFKARSSYNRYRYRGKYVYDYAEDEEGPDLVVNQDEADGEWLQSEIQGSLAYVSGHRLIAGLEHQANLNQAQSNYDEEVYLDISNTSSVTGVYVQDEWRLHPKLLLNAGLRFDHMTSFGSSWNPRFAAILQPGSATVVKALYGQAFRAPNDYELYYDDGETQVATGELRPESIDTYELVLQHQLGRTSTISGSVFQYTIDDLIVLVTHPDGELLTYRNEESARGRGLELQATHEFPRGIRSRVSYAYLDVQNIVMGHRLPNSPGHLVKFHLVAALGGRVTCGAEVLYAADRLTLTGAEVGQPVIANITLATAAVGRLSLSASVYNVLGAEFATPGSEEHVQDQIRQDGRRVRVEARARF